VNDRGSILPLIAGAALLALVVVFGVSAATSLVVERQRLFALADAAAVVAAESFNPRNVVLTSQGIVAPITSDEVRAYTVAYISAVGPGPLKGLALERALSVNGQVVEVRVSSVWSPPLVSDFFPTSLRIGVTARAQVFVR
jgi:hypothetical protein